MKVYPLTVSERELRVILSAFDIARDYDTNSRAEWWHNTKYAARLYDRLRRHGMNAAASA